MKSPCNCGIEPPGSISHEVRLLGVLRYSHSVGSTSRQYIASAIIEIVMFFLQIAAEATSVSLDNTHFLLAVQQVIIITI